MPAKVSSDWRDLLEHGAETAGFLRVEPLKEPIAAARGWLYDHQKTSATVLVLDCGGGTTDWAVVEMRDGRLSLSQQQRPQSLNLGGCDVDRALYRHVQQNDGERIKSQAPKKLIQRLKNYKETVFNGNSPRPLRIGGKTLALNETVVRETYQNAFISPLLQTLGPQLENIAQNHSGTEILLVGGGCTAELSQAIQRVTDLPVHELEDNALGVLLGSLATAESKASVTKDHSRAESWDTPDIHGWDTKQVQAWQQEVADKLGIAVVQQDPLKDGTKGPEMVLIPPGKYLMGSPPGEVGRDDGEGPQHQVTIQQPFLLAQCALRFIPYDHYCEVTGTKKPADKDWGRANRPVINVNWEEAKAYCLWLSQQTGLDYCLPTEAQWEYACRAGTTTPFWWGNQISTDQANYDGGCAYGNGPKGKYWEKTLPVESFDANPWGLYQMHGNVWEWMEDGWHDNYHGAPNDGRTCKDGESGHRVLCGGSWFDLPGGLRSAHRSRLYATTRGDDFGFRLARTC